MNCSAGRVAAKERRRRSATASPSLHGKASRRDLATRLGGNRQPGDFVKADAKKCEAGFPRKSRSGLFEMITSSDVGSMQSKVAVI
jgi:hypothetical protein